MTRGVKWSQMEPNLILGATIQSKSNKFQTQSIKNECQRRRRRRRRRGGGGGGRRRRRRRRPRRGLNVQTPMTTSTSALPVPYAKQVLMLGPLQSDKSRREKILQR